LGWSGTGQDIYQPNNSAGSKPANIQADSGVIEDRLVRVESDPAGSSEMKRRAVIAALAAGMSFPVLADDQPPGKAQPPYLLRLSDIMVATQLRHFKLWYAGQVKNWELANYELAQIRASFEDATRLSPNIPVASMATITQSADEVRSAIEAKDSAKFAKAIDKLTSACNSCHQAAGVGFIAIREPRTSPMLTSPLSDQAFRPK
jgi:hypothetical protein